jgi:hypothetical protein
MSGTGFAPCDEGQRFQVISLVGRGGMGVVYEAFDRHRQTRVALKRLREPNAAALYRFKQEFRTLADTSHPNLVALYELLHEAGEWFFTMEFVPGWDFLQYVRSGATAVSLPERTVTIERAVQFVPAPDAVRVPRARGGRCDLDRLRAVLIQIVRGLSALHQARIFHCDVKPSNVRVTPEGRAVILDFGLATNLAEQSENAHLFAGTLAYMSPEQMTGEPLTHQTDWFSVGVMLYQALTGTVPYAGTIHELTEQKRNGAFVRPSQRVPEIPADFEDLCLRMLAGAPEQRPDAAAILSHLESSSAAVPEVGHALSQDPFVGRESHLAVLDNAVVALGAHETGIVVIHGPPGTGKTTILERFRERYAANEDFVVLSGRCREQESVPFKALDAVVDGLARYLRRQPERVVLTSIPRHADALAQMFLVLRTVPIFAQARGHGDAGDSQFLRRRAGQALRELLCRIGDDRKLIVIIDDVQWGDADSARLISELLMPPDPPALLLVLASRVSPRTGRFLEILDSAEVLRSTRRWEIDAGPLPETDCIAVASALLPAPDPDRATAIARDSGGNAYLLHELATSGVSPDAGSAQRPSLESVLRGKIARLPVDAQRLLEVVSVSGQPTRLDDLHHAAGLPAISLGAISALRANRLLSSTGLREDDLLEPYHDRVRETVLAQLPAETLRGWHLSLARTLEVTDRADSETLARHFEAGGELEPAARYSLWAARHAAAATAFDHAARLLIRALDLGDWTPEQQRSLRIELADALANAGRSLQAAQLYKQAVAETADHPDFTLARKAAYHFSISGHVEEASAEFARVLRHAGVRFPKTMAGTVGCLLAARVALRLRGLRHRVRAENQIPPELLERLEAAQAATAGFGLIDVARSVSFNARALLLALEAGEPNRIIYSLALETAARAVSSSRGEREAERLLVICRDLVRQHPSPRSRMMLAMGEGLVGFATGQWERAVRCLSEGEAILDRECPGMNWECTTITYTLTLSHVNAGHYEQVAPRLPDLLRLAEERGDLYLLNSLRAYVVPLTCLAADNPDAAESAIEHVESWFSEQIYLQHVVTFISRILAFLYREQYVDAWNYSCRRWPAVRRKLYLYGANSEAYCLFLKASAAIAAAAVTPDPRPMLRDIKSDVRRLSGLHPRFAKPMAVACRAGVASLEDTTRAAELFREAAEEFEKAEMPVLAAACQVRTGLLRGGDSGRALLESAHGVLRTHAIARPDRFAAALVSSFLPPQAPRATPPV